MTTHVEADCRLDVDAGSIPVASTIFMTNVLSFDDSMFARLNQVNHSQAKHSLAVKDVVVSFC